MIELSSVEYYSILKRRWNGLDHMMPLPRVSLLAKFGLRLKAHIKLHHLVPSAYAVGAASSWQRENHQDFYGHYYYIIIIIIVTLCFKGSFLSLFCFSYDLHAL